MITEKQIAVKITQLVLSAETETGKYSQCYNLSDKTKTNYVPDIKTAKQQFMEFYNQFE